MLDSIGDSELRWPEESSAFTDKSLDRLYLWAWNLGASGIRLQTDDPIVIQLHGRVYKVTHRTLSWLEVEEAVNHLYGADGQARLKSGEDFDVAYEIQPDRSTRRRFRVNATPVLSNGNDGAEITARPLPDHIPRLEELNVEPGILENCRSFRDGLAIISGATGNGKSTLMAGIIRKTLEDPTSNSIILTYESPIEFVFDKIKGPTSKIAQTEIPRHLVAGFGSAIRNGVRREPTDIVVGECRDADTMSAAANAALTGHRVYTTVHASTVSATIQRIVSLCPVEERASLTVAIAQTMRLIVNQRLVFSTDGRRTALREFLPFTRQVQDMFLDARPDDWHKIARTALLKHGQTFGVAARRALDEGRILEDIAKPFLEDAI